MGGISEMCFDIGRVEMIEYIELHPVTVGIVESVLGLLITVFLFYCGQKILNKKEFLDNKPYISVLPRFEKHSLPNTSGFIRWIEIGNYGKSVALDVVIKFIYTRVWENPHKEEEIVIDGKYEIKYLPPSFPKKYFRPYTKYDIQDGWYPEQVVISYRFRGQLYTDKYDLISKNREDRGYELEEYNSSKDNDLQIRSALK